MPTDANRDQQIHAILHAYLQAVDAGQAPDREAIICQHPDLADELRAFFVDQKKLKELADSLRTHGSPPAPSEPPTISTKELHSDSGPLRKVRYFGDYQLLDEIARGGMGVVYRAKQVSLNRLVALKMILAGQLAGETDVKRFVAEAQAAARLQHPNIVAIHEVGEYQGQHYFSMDYVKGQSLAELVREHPLPPAQAAAHAEIIAAAVHYAHEQGTLHRDLKPSNVLIDRFDQPRLTDFGLAKRLDQDAGLTATGAVLGTPGYMPPEQAAGDSARLGHASFPVFRSRPSSTRPATRTTVGRPFKRTTAARPGIRAARGAAVCRSRRRWPARGSQ